MNLYMAAAFVLYFAVLLAIGFFFYKHNQSARDFMVGSRSIQYWVTAIATQASDMSGWLFLGFPAMIFIHGMFEIWTAVGLVGGMWLTWTIVAPKLRAKTAELGVLTLSSYFAHCFGDRSGAIQLISSLFALIFCLFYIASGLVGLSLVFGSAFGLGYKTGIMISMITTVLFTLVGGFVAVAWSNFFQGIFLLIAIMLVLFFGLIAVGGPGSVIEAAYIHGISLSPLSSTSNTLLALFQAASWGLGYFGQPHILMNFMGIDDERNIKRARRVGIAWQIAVLTMAASIGLVGISFFPSGICNPELLFPMMSKALFHPFIAGLVLCGIIAATLSTVDSLILVSGSSFAEDIYKNFFHRTATSGRILLISRLGSIIVSCLALMLAWSSSNTVYGLVNYAWSGLGSTFGPLVVASLISNKVTPAGAVVGVCVGGTVSALWPFIVGTLPLVPGFVSGLVTVGIVSYVTGTNKRF